MHYQLVAAAAILLPATSVAAGDQRRVEPRDPQPVLSAGLSQHKFNVVKPIPEKCPTLAAQVARKRGESLTPDKLTELPPAEAFHAVYRTGPDGCPDPVMVGYQYEQDR